MKKKTPVKDNRGRKVNVKMVLRAKELYQSKRPDGRLMTYRDVAAKMKKDVRNVYDWVNYDLNKIAAV